VINVFKEKNIKHFTKSNAIEKMSFQSSLKRGSDACGRSDLLRKLVPDRGGCDDKDAITNCRTWSSWNGKSR